MATQKRFIAENGLDNNSNTIPNVADPVNSQDVATKNYTTSNFLGSSSSAYPTMYPTLNLDFANSKQLDSRITFTRNSIATYYDGQTTALAEQNLLTYSQDFTNAIWGKAFVTIGTLVSAPDGTTTAATLTADGTSNGHRMTIGLSSGYIKCFSLYVKAGTNNFVQIYFDADANPYVNFNISAGTVGTSGTNVTGSITSVGSGWYRISVYTTSLTATNVVVTLTTSTSAIRAETNTLATSIYLWGAQLEQRSSVTAYTTTTSSAITNYIPVLMTASANIPRFNCDPITGKSLGLLIEESRTNLATYSSDFSLWTAINSPVIDKTANVAPDGTQTNNLFTAGAASARCQRNAVTVTASIPYTISIYAKAGNASYLTLGSAASPATSAIFNLTTGVVSNTVGSPISTSITSVGNGEYRCTITLTPTTTSLTVILGVGSTNTFASSNFPTNSIGDSGYIWGAQLEAGSFATSYIPTVASTVTRAIDAAVMTGTNFSSWYNQSQGTMYVESNSASSSVGAISVEFAASNGTTRGYIGNNINSGIARFSFTSTPNNIIGGTIVSGSTNKYVGSWVFGGNMSLTLNGSLIGTAVAPASPSYFNGVSTDYASMLAFYDINSGGGSNTLNGHIKKVMYYPVALSAPNLVALTT